LGSLHAEALLESKNALVKEKQLAAKKEKILEIFAWNCECWLFIAKPYCPLYMGKTLRAYIVITRDRGKRGKS